MYSSYLRIQVVKCAIYSISTYLQVLKRFLQSITTLTTTTRTTTTTTTTFKLIDCDARSENVKIRALLLFHFPARAHCCGVASNISLEFQEKSIWRYSDKLTNEKEC